MWRYQMYPSYYGGPPMNYGGYQQAAQYQSNGPQSSPEDTRTQRRLSDQDQRVSSQQSNLPRMSSFFSMDTGGGGGGGGNSYYGGGNGYSNYGAFSGYGSSAGSFYGMQQYDSSVGQGAENHSMSDLYDDNTSRMSVNSQRSSASRRSGVSQQHGAGGSPNAARDDDRNFSRLVRKKSTLHKNTEFDSGVDNTHRIGRSKRITMIGEEIL